MGSERKTDTGARHTSSSCSSVIAYHTSWSRHWEGKLSIPLSSDLGEYTISLETSRPLTNLTFWDGNLTGAETSFTLEGPPYFQGKTSGQILDHGFQLEYSGSTEPVFTSIKLNGVELCKVCRDEFSLWKDGCYYISEVSGITWNESRDQCDSLSSTLSSITSQEEQNWIVSHAPSDWAQEYGVIFIGGTDAASEGNWTWVDGQPWIFSNWNVDAKEPNNAGTGENCAEVRGNELWNDISCDSSGTGRAVYVCSYDPYE